MELKLIWYRGKRALWSPVKVRKHHHCGWCEESIKVSEPAYRPVGNMNYRMVRICADCAAKISDAA